MSLDDILSERRAPLYTRPYQLPANVAFEVLEYANVPKRNSSEKCHRIIIKNDEFVNMMVYPGMRFQKLTDDKIDELNREIKGGQKYYLVARRWTSLDRVPLDLVSEAKRQAQKVPIFDSDTHVIRVVDGDGKLVSDPFDERSPKKFKKEY